MVSSGVPAHTLPPTLLFGLTRHSCPDNLLSPSTLRSLLKDIREVRQAKLRTAIMPQIGVEGTGLNGEYLQVSQTARSPRHRSEQSS